MSSRVDPPELGWHVALAYAVTGRALDDLGEQVRPEPAGLVIALNERVIAGELPRPDGTSHIVPPELMAGLGSAQFSAALSAVRSGFGIDGLTRRPPALARPLTADDRRLLAEVPPHHGS